MTTSRHAFGAAAVEYDRGSRLFKPALAFEWRNAITGIAGDYYFPNGQTASAFEASLDYNRTIQDCYRPPRECDFQIERIAAIPRDTMRRLLADWRELQYLNPVLDAVEVEDDDGFSMLHAVNGTACLLNPNDIAFYIAEMARTGSYQVFTHLLQDPVYADSFQMTQTLAADNYIGWVPSPETLEDIQTALAQSTITRPFAPG